MVFVVYDAMSCTAEHITGILSIRVSTIGAADEKDWATAEEHLNGSSKLQLQANFGPGSAGVSIPWATTINTQDADSGKLRRDAKVICYHVTCVFITAVLGAHEQHLPNIYASSLPDLQKNSTLRGAYLPCIFKHIFCPRVPHLCLGFLVSRPL